MATSARCTPRAELAWAGALVVDVVVGVAFGAGVVGTSVGINAPNPRPSPLGLLMQHLAVPFRVLLPCKQQRQLKVRRMS